MAKLRHIAMQVPDLEEAAKFYETVFEFERCIKAETPYGDAVMLSDGVMNLTLLNFPPGSKGMHNDPSWAGLHHFGVVVDDKDAMTKKIEAAGGTFYMQLPEGVPGLDAETKFKDPNGIVFDISEHDWTQARKG